ATRASGSDAERASTAMRWAACSPARDAMASSSLAVRARNERPEASTAWGFRFIRSPFASSPPFASSSLETRANADDGTSPSSLRDAGQVASGLFDIALVLEHQVQGGGDELGRQHVRVEQRQALRPIQRLADRGRLLQIEGANLADRVYHLLRQF